MKKKVFIVLLTLSSLLTSLYVSELLLRTFAKYSYSVRLLTANPERGTDIDRIVDWKTLIESTTYPPYPGMIQNGFVFNDRGFETPNLPYAKKANTKRIVLIGDSFAVGVVPYPLRFIRILETSLNKEIARIASDARLEVINLGLSGVGPALERKAFEVEGIKYQPDYVILSFFVGNDFTDDKADLDRIRNLNYTPRKLKGLPMWLYDIKLVLLLRNLHILFQPFNFPSASFRSEKQTGVYTGLHMEEYDPMMPTMPRDTYLKLGSERLGIYKKDSWHYKQLNDVYKNILEMKRLSESVGAKFLVVVIPDEMQVDSLLLDAVLSYSGNSSKDIDITLPQRLLNDFFRENNISSIDLLPYFLNDAYPERPYQPFDAHINIFGNQRVADILFRYLQPIIQDDFQRDVVTRRSGSVLGVMETLKDKLFR